MKKKFTNKLKCTTKYDVSQTSWEKINFQINSAWVDS